MLSERQILYRDYLITKIGFIKDAFFSAYLEKLTRSAHKFRYLEAKPIPSPELIKSVDDYGDSAYAIEGEQFRTYDMKNGLLIPRRYSVIDFFNFEYQVKRNLQLKLKESQTTYISATDLSNFTYCPASFSISKTFDIKKIESAYHGTGLHDSHRLINFLSSKLDIDQEISTGLPYSGQSIVNGRNEYFFKEIKESSLIYHGHSMNQRQKYFKSVKGDYVGQPDYILQNLHKNYYVVEEKFQYQSSQNKKENHFYENHINQLTSYLYGISEYNIQYGYLVYWKFDFDYGVPFIHSCHVTKIEKADVARNQLVNVYSKLKSLVNNKVEVFDISGRNPNKCANCVSNLLCGHKTGRFSTLKFPYSTDYLKTYHAEFPKELKKDQIGRDVVGSKKIIDLDDLA